MLPIRRKSPKPNHLLREIKPPAGVKQFRTSMKDLRSSVERMFRGVLPQIQMLINGATDTDGNLIYSQRQRVAQQAGELVHRLFVGTDGRSAFAQDGVTAIAQYPQILNEYYVRVVMEAIYAQRDWLKRNMPAELFNWLTRQPFSIGLSEAENPFLRRDDEDDEAFLKRMKDLRVFHPNPLAELDPNRRWVPMHNWTDDKGYQLSDRIWNTANDTRTLIDRLIMKAFNEGWSAVQLAKELEQYLVNGAGGYSAMRLARTEIARAANHAAYMSAYLNPYVDGLDVVRSANGDRTCTICPKHATINFGGERIRPPYSLHSANVPPYHPHDMCHCRGHVTDNPAAVTQRLQAVMQDARAHSFPPAVTPANADAFTNMLLHRSLGTLVAQVKGQLPLLGF
jgi:hypothetical protein